MIGVPKNVCWRIFRARNLKFLALKQLFCPKVGIFGYYPLLSGIIVGLNLDRIQPALLSHSAGYWWPPHHAWWWYSPLQPAWWIIWLVHFKTIVRLHIWLRSDDFDHVIIWWSHSAGYWCLTTPDDDTPQLQPVWWIFARESSWCCLVYNLVFCDQIRRQPSEWYTLGPPLEVHPHFSICSPFELPRACNILYVNENLGLELKVLLIELAC